MYPKQSYGCNEETLQTKGQMETSLSNWTRKWKLTAIPGAICRTRMPGDQNLTWRTVNLSE